MMWSVALFTHIAAGFLALAVAGVALGTRKGGRAHILAGRIYVGSMLMVTLTTFVLIAIVPNTFLLVIAIFSFYLVFTGWRAGMVRDGEPRTIDGIAGWVMFATALSMIGIGGRDLLAFGEFTGRPMILTIFGVIGLLVALEDVWRWPRSPARGRERIARHLTRMLAGTIATVTAAVVVNVTFVPQIVTWLGPTAVITPVIFWWNARVLSGKWA